ncbi:MAG: hypothetical protein LBU40_04735 [Methanobrevibacter sp.]|jgi:hypothetical protein|nr:hypothetical protein [Methanobrevibacter sp.]
MASLGKSFACGILLIIMGIIIIVQTIIFHFKDIFMFVGIIVLILGAFLIFSGVHAKSKLKVPKLNTKYNNHSQGFDFGNNNQNKSSDIDLRKKISPILSKNGKNNQNFNNGNFNKRRKKSNKAKLNKSNGSKVVSDIFSPPPEENYLNDKELVIKPTYNKPHPISRRPKKRSVPLTSVDLEDNNIPNNLNNNSNNNLNNNLNNNPSNNPDNGSNSRLNTSSQNASKDNEILTRLQSEDANNGNVSSSVPGASNYNKNNKENRMDNENENDSYVLCENKFLTTFKAFEHIAKRANKELSIETINLKSVSEEFLSTLLSLDVKILLKNFDFKDLSYVLLLSSLIEQGAEVRVSDFVNTTNIIADDNYALIISSNEINDDIEVGALYTDKNLVENIKNSFVSTWAIAKVLEINLSHE